MLFDLVHVATQGQWMQRLAHFYFWGECRKWTRYDQLSICTYSSETHAFCVRSDDGILFLRRCFKKLLCCYLSWHVARRHVDWLSFSPNFPASAPSPLYLAKQACANLGLHFAWFYRRSCMVAIFLWRMELKQSHQICKPIDRSIPSR